VTIARIIQGRSAQVFHCTADNTVREAIALLAEKRIGALPVLANGSVAGIFSERDVVFRLANHGPDGLDMKVGDVMTAPAVTIAPETDVIAALSLMTERRIRHLPIVVNGVMTGFVSIGDLVKYRIEQVQAEAEAMRTYIQTA